MSWYGVWDAFTTSPVERVRNDYKKANAPLSDAQKAAIDAAKAYALSQKVKLVIIVIV